MNKRNRIKKDKEFQAVFKKGRSFANRQFVVYILQKEGQEELRLGLSVSKKIGNAVVRNRIKRYIRQVFLELKEELRQDLDYVVIARKPVAEMDFHQSKSSMKHVLKKTGALKKDEKRRSH